MADNEEVRTEEEAERAVNAEYVRKFGDSEGSAPLQVTSIPHKALYRVTRLLSGKFILMSDEDIYRCVEGKGNRAVIKALKRLRKF